MIRSPRRRRRAGGLILSVACWVRDGLDDYLTRHHSDCDIGRVAFSYHAEKRRADDDRRLVR